MNWQAQYNDGSGLSQFEEDGKENKYADIDRNRIDSFALYLDDGRLAFRLWLDPGQRLIYRRRVEISTGCDPFAVYLCGWQRTIAGENVQSVAYVTECGEVHLAGKWRDDHRWFYAIQPVPAEEEKDGTISDS